MPFETSGHASFPFAEKIKSAKGCQNPPRRRLSKYEHEKKPTLAATFTSKALELVPSAEITIGIPLGMVTVGCSSAACGTAIGALIGGPPGAGIGYLIGLGLGSAGGAVAGVKAVTATKKLMQ
ncbi:MAG TPA: hypothetical protein PLJ27_21280 [Polyangiaceae bacterium]|nr:hypothetical protein [Polyangiaceae bacterium]